jgi:hypothetical protein
MTVLKMAGTIISAIACMAWYGWGFAKEQGIKEYKSSTTQAMVREHRKDIAEIKNDISDLKRNYKSQTQSLRQIKKHLKIVEPVSEPRLVRR